jgi:predicted CXXCH cytochrome family protein
MTRAHDKDKLEDTLKLKILYISMILLVLISLPSIAFARGIKSHMETSVNPGECMSCHSGRGISGTALLRQGRQKLCYDCHGDNLTSKRKNLARTNIMTVMEKLSAHPVNETSSLHRAGEQLPETDSARDRHVACEDCHIVHVSTDLEPTKGSKGYRPGSMRSRIGSGPPTGIRVREATDEYQICYLCHSDSANLPVESRNIAFEFNPLNASYHPVEAKGRNKYVPSLTGGMTENSYIRCISCHNNDDPSGPSGPHGSDYENMLVLNYRTEDGPEFRKSYELCYMCHRRTSILGDDSFKLHQYHIVAYETSCHTCHSAHGSDSNEALIAFNEDVVSDPVSGGSVLYIPGSGGRPKCFLNCHGVEHSSAGVAGKSWPW